MGEPDSPPLTIPPGEDRALYQRLVELAPDAVAIHVKGTVAYANPAALRLFRAESPEAVVGRSVLDFVHPDDQDLVRRRMVEMQRAGTPVPRVEERFVALDGTHIIGEVEAAPFSHNGERAILVIIRDVTERRRIEEELARSRDQLQVILQTVDDGVTVQDSSGRVVYANDAAARLVGFADVGRLLTAAPADIMRRYQVFDQEGNPMPPESLPGRRVLQGEEVGPVVLCYRFPDTGEERWAEVSARPIRDERGRVRFVVNVFRDVTARRRAEERTRFLDAASQILASSLDPETTLVNVARLAVPRIADWCVVDLVSEDGTVERVATAHADPEKEAWAREIDRKYPARTRGATAAIGRGRSTIVAEVTDEVLRSAAQDQEHLEILRGLGITSAMTIPLQARDRILGAMTFLATESGRQFNEEDLRQAEDLAQRAALAVDNAQLYAESVRRAAEQSAIVRQMTEGVLIADMSGHITFTNDAARRLFGGSASAPGSGPTAAPRTVHIDGRLVPLEETVLGRALQGEAVVDVQRRVRLAGGREIVTRTSASPLRAEDGTQFGAVATVRDVTEQHTLAQQREDFLAAAAHDLKTPLAAIKAVAQLLTRRAERDGSLDPAQLVDNLHRIEATATRMSHLINELLDGTRVYQSQPLELQRQPVDLVALMDRVCHEQRLSERFEIQCESETSELVGFWDEMRIERVIVNLISNAVKYSPEGGLILIRLRCEERRGQVWAVLTVEDQGMGIPAADLPHIFERFYRGSNVPRDIAGTGIGLAGVQQIVEQHGGSVLVESHEGKGSRFTVRLPLGSGE